MGTICWQQEAADRIQHVAVEDLVLSQENKPKRHRSAREILHKTGTPHSIVHRIIHSDIQLKCFKQHCAQLCLKPISSPISLADKQSSAINFAVAQIKK